MNNHQIENPFNLKADLRHVNVYAEVRGKYARPAPANKHAFKIPLLTPKENLLIARPLTAGSLQSRSSSYRKSIKHEQSPEKISEKPISQQYKRRYRKLSHDDYSIENQEQNRITFEHDLEEKTSEKHEENINDPENKPEENDQINPEEMIENDTVPLNDKSSEVTGLTTTSQKRYIQELELLLRKERLHRITLEESLRKVTEDK